MYLWSWSILEPSAFQKYSICWVFQAFFCSTFFYMYFATRPRPALTAVTWSLLKLPPINIFVTFIFFLWSPPATDWVLVMDSGFHNVTVLQPVSKALVVITMCLCWVPGGYCCCWCRVCEMEPYGPHHHHHHWRLPCMGCTSSYTPPCTSECTPPCTPLPPTVHGLHTSLYCAIRPDCPGAMCQLRVCSCAQMSGGWY